MARAPSFTSFSALAAAVCALGVAFFAAPAHAQQNRNGWQVCNETSYILEAATARPDGRAVVVQGWTRLRPGECRTTVNQPLARGVHYLYARSSPAHRGGRRQWTGDATLCVDPGRQFTIENPPQCAPMALEERSFRRVQINKRDAWRTSFAEATNFTLTRARQAGIQRLLVDAGYEIRQGRGGIDPRAIAAAIAQFRASARLQPNATEDQLIDALETAARRRSNLVGLTLCNRTNARIWTAIARRRGEGWESRGWWVLGPQGCVRALDEALIQEFYYVHATMQTDQGPRFLAAGGAPFCTSPARFAILSRDDCEQRYYDRTLFARIPSRDRPGLVLDLREADFLDLNVAPREIELGPDGAVTGNRDPNTTGRRPPPPAGAPDATQDRPSR
jgi:uncharacterized membrane protein